MSYYDADPFFYTGEGEELTCETCDKTFIKYDKHCWNCQECVDKQGEGENE